MTLTITTILSAVTRLLIKIFYINLDSPHPFYIAIY